MTSATSAAGQTEDATIDLTVRYQNGNLVTDRAVCATYYFSDGDRLTGSGITTIGSTASVPVNSGALMGVRVGGNCVTTTTGLETFTWHNGQPADPSSSGRPWDALIESDLITVQPGSNAINITVGAARLSGTVSISSPAQPSACFVTAVGTSAISGDLGPLSTRVEDDGSWEIWLHPGTYTIETSCFLRSAFEAWPNQAWVADATAITVTNGQDRTGINFDMDDRFNEEAGTNLFINFSSNEEYDTPKCIEAYTLNGTLVRRQFSSSVSVADNGQYRVLVTDCFELGFDDQWFPAGASRTTGPSLTIDGSTAEQNFDAAPLFGIEFTECNGQEVTIRGTAGDDVITGTAGRDVISGLGGNDEIHGLGGDDIIFGGDGNDFIRSFKHDDTVDGGPGNDIIRGGWGNDVLRGGTGNDIIRAYFGADRLFGNEGNDVLLGGGGPDFIVGGPGASDRLFGEAGTKDECNDVGPDSEFTGCEKIN